MKNKILILILLTLSTKAFCFLNNGEPSFGQYPNQEAIQGAYVPSKMTTYHTADCSSSVSAFASKSNAYAESPIVRVIAQTKGVHVKWGSSLPTATGDDYLVLANTYVDFVVDPNNRYLAILQESGTAEAYVVEIK